MLCQYNSEIVVIMPQFLTLKQLNHTMTIMTNIIGIKALNAHYISQFATVNTMTLPPGSNVRPKVPKMGINLTKMGTIVK